MRWPAPLAALLLLASATQPVLAQAVPDDDLTAPLALPADTVDAPDFTITDADRQAIQASKPDIQLPDGDPYWGANVGGYTSTLIDTFEADSHKHLSILSWGEAWSRNGTLQPFQTSAMTAVRARGTIPMVTWDSWVAGDGPNQPAFQLADITGGAYDSYIRAWATAAKAWGHPFFLRFEHEMNGNWYPWSERTNGNSAGQFVTMWRHVHNIFASVGATNAVWVWCPNISGVSSTTDSELYPGDQYVDWTCLDGYNFAGLKAAPWQTITQVFRGGQVSKHDSYAEVLAVAPTKPLMIGETASTENGGSKSDWITSALTHELPANMPQVKALIWFNRGDVGADWPIESSPSATAAFADSIAGAYWEPNVYSTIGSIDTLMEGQAVPATVAGAGHVTLSPLQDAFVSQGTPTTNYGKSTEIQASDGSQIAYLQFDLSSLAGHTITGATLHLHTSTQTWAGSASKFSAFLVQQGWSETGITWDTRPIPSTTLVGSVNDPASLNTWYAITLSPAIVNQMAGGTLNLALTGSVSDIWDFYSREKDSGLQPTLDLTF